MQISLTQQNKIYSFYVNKKRKINVKIIIILCIIIIVTISILILSLKNNYKTDFFDAKSYYLVSIYQTQNVGQVENLQLKVEDIGGAAYKYLAGRDYYIIARAYMSRVDADRVVNKNKKDYPDCKVIEVSSKKVKKSIKREIEQTDCLLRAYKYLSQLPNEMYELSIRYDQGKLNEREVFTKMVEQKTILNEHISWISAEQKLKDNPLFTAFLSNIAVYIEDIEFSLNEQYRNDPLDLSLKLVSVKLCLDEIAFKNAINNC